MIRIDMERARGGAVLGRMRRVLVIGLALAVGAMTLIRSSGRLDGGELRATS